MMETAQLDTMESLEGKQLVLRISGAVEQSNLAEFEETAFAVISSINTDLQTDEDFATAELDIKSIQRIETRIHNARQDALSNTAEIATLIATTERLEAQFREKRLFLTRSVKTEKEARKAEILADARNAIAGLIMYSPVKHGFSIDNKALTESAKNKRSLAKMREALAEVVEAETLRLANVEADFQVNIEAIKKAEAEYPGIFQDKQNLALSPVDVVAAQIESRIVTFKYEQEMKAKRKREAAEELERRTKELEKKQAEVAAKQAEEEDAAARLKTGDAKVIDVPEPFSPEPPVFEDPFSDNPLVKISVLVSPRNTDVATIAWQIQQIDGVLQAVVQR